MNLQKVKTEQILMTAHSALKKVKEDDYLSVENISDCIAKLKFRCKESGYRLLLAPGEFFDFIGGIIAEVKRNHVVAVVSVARNTPVDKLKELRVLCDNAEGAATDVNDSLKGYIMLEIVKIKPELAPEYSIDYATKLL